MSKSNVWAPRRQNDAGNLRVSREAASERISADIDAFLRRGGAIEVLGTTQMLKRLSGLPKPEASPAESAEAPTLAT